MKPRIDLFAEGIGEQLALTVTCPTKECAAAVSEVCRPYTHWVRVLDAVFALPRPVERDV